MRTCRAKLRRKLRDWLLRWTPKLQIISQSTASSSKSRCSCTKSPLSAVRRTSLTSSHSARQIRSDDPCVQHRPMQLSSDVHVWNSDDVRSRSAARTYGMICHRLYAPLGHGPLYYHPHGLAHLQDTRELLLSLCR